MRTYRGKRHFGRTREPHGDGPGRTGGGDPRFVVQIHDASTLHFDFRLEVDGVLKSWSVPKGPPSDPAQKRLAVPTEDHPLEYREFEGVIAEGEYGAGTVVVWDEGTYRPLPPGRRDRRGLPFADALADGHVSFRLHGAKLRGDYALTRFRGGGKRDSWLLVRERSTGKGGGSGRGAPADPARARSVRSGRTLRQVAAAEPADDEGSRR
ncbi:3'-phosphoesterase [Streptomyces sp. JJ36]|nr:3'-phosphoesterase [Streptomyces sp. JJ36]